MSLDLMHTFHIGTVELGFISSTFFYSNLVLLLISGFLLDYFSLKRLVILVMGVSLAGSCFFIIKQNIYSLYIWRIAAGLATAFAITGAMKFVSTKIHAGKVGFYIGMIGTAATFGGVLAQTPLQLCLDKFGPIGSLKILVGFGLLIMILMIIFVKTDLSHSRHMKKSDSNFLTVILNKRNWYAALFDNFMNLPLFVLGALWGTAYLIQTHFLNPVTASIVISMMFFGHMVGAPTFGFLTDRINSRRLLMCSGAVISIIGVIIINYTALHNFVILSVIFFLLGFSTGVQCVTDTFVINTNKANAGKAASLLSMVAITGGAVFQPFFGYVVHHGGNGFQGYKYALSILLITPILALLLSFLIPNK